MHPDTMIQWMDVDTGSVIDGPVKDLFQRYAYKAEYKTVLRMNCYHENMAVISFEGLNVKITDGYGWTDIVSMYKQPRTSFWKKLSVGDRELILNRFVQLPIYRQSEIHSPERGFHGEIKYSYTIETMDQIHSFDQDHEHVRIFDLKDEEFRIPIIVDLFDIGVEDEYKITTKSRFFNANKIQMFGDLIMTNEEIFKLGMHFGMRDKFLEEMTKEY